MCATSFLYGAVAYDTSIRDWDVESSPTAREFREFRDGGRRQGRKKKKKKKTERPPATSTK